MRLEPFETYFKDHPRTWLVVLFGLALLARVLFVLYVPVKPTAGGDPGAYAESASNLVATGVLYSHEGVAFRSPLYPYFIAAVYRVAGESPTNVFIAQAFLGALGALLLWGALQPLGGRVASLATLLYAVHPLMLFYTKQMLTESLYTFLVLLIVNLGLHAVEGRRGAILALGFGTGLAVLCRSEALALAALCWMGLVLFRRGERIKTLAIVALSIIGAAMVVAPWLIRNYVLLGAPVLTTEAGVTFYLGNNPEATGGYHMPTAPLASLPSGELERNSYYFQLVWDYVRTNPLAAVELLPKKQAALWALNKNPVLDGADVVLLPLVVLGLAVAVRRRERWWHSYFLIAPVVTVLLTSTVAIGQVRFRTSLYPFLIAFAAVALAAILQRVNVFRARTNAGAVQPGLAS